MRMCVVCLSSPTSIRCQASVIETETKKFEMIYSQGQIFGMNSVLLLVNIEKIISLKKVRHKKQMLAHTPMLSISSIFNTSYTQSMAPFCLG